VRDKHPIDALSLAYIEWPQSGLPQWNHGHMYTTLLSVIATLEPCTRI